MAAAEVEGLIADAVAGREAAWRKLWLTLEPMLLRIARSPRVSGRMSESEDDCRNVVVEVMARLRDDGYRRLRLFLSHRESNPGLGFEPWLRVVARRVTIDYMRGHGDYIDKRRNRNPSSAPGQWIVHSPLTSSSRLHGVRPPVTNRNAAMTMLRYAYKELPKKQLRALERWIVGTGHAEIAAELELDSSDDAKKLVRAALQRLRREFRGSKKAKK